MSHIFRVDDGNSVYYHGEYTEEDKRINAYVIKQFGINIFECPRYRSWEVSLTKPKMKLTGRYGGSNRKDYKKEIKSFINKYRNIFIQDKQDELDRTYSTFHLTLDLDKWNEFRCNWQKEFKNIKEETTKNEKEEKEFKEYQENKLKLKEYELKVKNYEHENFEVNNPHCVSYCIDPAHGYDPEHHLIRKTK